jgi:hypothetical protein
MGSIMDNLIPLSNISSIKMEKNPEYLSFDEDFIFGNG